ncbi:MAG: class I SAM-dependent methyltransferase, partial [Alphaproteobacteria bacterium]
IRGGMESLYDTIGLNYAKLRLPDPRIAQQLDAALGNAQTVLNVGAGAGSYEPAGRQITALEPSAEMIKQHPGANATVIRGSAEDLPFDDKSFDAAMAVLTIHHWADQERGVKEMARVTRGKIVFLTFNPSFRGFWLTDYFPALVTLDEGQMPQMADYENWLGPVEITPVPIPHDCTDGFFGRLLAAPGSLSRPKGSRCDVAFLGIG